MHTLAKINISQDWLDMEQNLSWSIYGKAKKIMKKDACMKFYDASRPLNLENDTSGVCLGTRLLQVSNGINCGHDEVPGN